MPPCPKSAQGGRLVTGLRTDEATGAVTGVVARTRDGEEEVHEADAVVFAVSVAGMQKLVAACPALAAREEFRNVMNLPSSEGASERARCTARRASRLGSPAAHQLAGWAS